MAGHRGAFGSSVRDLPSDALLTILRKLAVTDPCSLLPATCAFRAFRQQVKENPGIWKLAFIGKDLGLEDRSREAEIEEAVSSLGGYERLVKTRTRGECPKRLGSCEQTQRPWLLRDGSTQSLPEDVPEEISLRVPVTKHLVIMRDQGRLVLWSLLTSHIKSSSSWLWEMMGDFSWERTSRRGHSVPDPHNGVTLRSHRLQPVSCCSSSGTSNLEESASGKRRVEYSVNGRTLTGPISMEIYRFPDRMGEPFPFCLPIPRGSRAWKCRIFSSESNEIPAFRLSGRFYVVFPETDECKNACRKRQLPVCTIL